jgi:hypothetical protein
MPAPATVDDHVDALAQTMEAAVVLLQAGLPKGLHCALLVFDREADGGLALVSTAEPTRTLAALREALARRAPQ